MKKFFIFILILLALFVLLYFLGGMQTEVSVPSQEVTTEEPQKEPVHEAARVVEDTCTQLRGDKQDQCYQQLAVESKNLMYCDKIVAERFRHLEENPPRDKCYSMVAAERCDPDICDQMKGGHEFFTPTSCKQRISRLCTEVH